MVRRPDTPLAQAVALACRDAKLNPMRALIVLSGDDAEGNQRARRETARLRGAEGRARIPRVAGFGRAAAKGTGGVAARNWSRPAAGEVLLLVLDDAEAVTAERG